MMESSSISRRIESMSKFSNSGKRDNLFAYRNVLQPKHSIFSQKILTNTVGDTVT